MYKKILFAVVFCIFIFSCSKSDSSSGIGGNTSNTIEYRITTGNSQNLSLSYNDKDQTTIGGIGASGWTLNFTTTKKPFTAYLRGVPYNPTNPALPVTLNLKILVNGNVVLTQDFSGTGNADGQIQYVVQ